MGHPFILGSMNVKGSEIADREGLLMYVTCMTRGSALRLPYKAMWFSGAAEHRTRPTYLSFYLSILHIPEHTKCCLIELKHAEDFPCSTGVIFPLEVRWCYRLPLSVRSQLY